jgi:LacI family transcriptional regulator
MRGAEQSVDSETRWNAICAEAKKLGIRMRRELIVQLKGGDPTPNLGYPFAKQLLAREQPFSALFAYNDVSAIGAVAAFQEHGIRVPEDISVVGFDDIQAAGYINPPLTTVRQPMLHMGETAARTLIDRLEGRMKDVAEIMIEPELMVRRSTAGCADQSARWKDRLKAASSAPAAESKLAIVRGKLDATS